MSHKVLYPRIGYLISCVSLFSIKTKPARESSKKFVRIFSSEMIISILKVLCIYKTPIELFLVAAFLCYKVISW